MPYFAPERSRAYWCPHCRAWWLAAVPAVSCCVVHSPGSCCHYGETQTAQPVPVAPPPPPKPPRAFNWASFGK